MTTVISRDTSVKLKKVKILLEKSVLYLILFVLSFSCIFPFYMMLSGGFKDNGELITMEQNLWPEQLDMRKYVGLFNRFPYGRILFNTSFYAAVKVLLGVLFCTLAGFAFAKYAFPGRTFLFVVLLGTMMIPFQSIVVPSYLLINNFGWLNTFYGLIIPGAVPAFGTFLMRQYIIGMVPDELLDAARIDGCSEFKLFWLIGFPMAMSGAWVLAVLLFMANWNAFLWPLVIINKEEMFLCTIAVQTLSSDGVWQDYGIILAASTIGSLPVLIIFLFVQKRFISGLMTGFGK